jgi:hypothetical protein
MASASAPSMSMFSLESMQAKSLNVFSLEGMADMKKQHDQEELQKKPQEEVQSGSRSGEGTCSNGDDKAVS